ncbi:MAG: glycine cleavage system protein H [Candidatus Brockarchaeota archaeon]|nr:glycine cleavage system protein H [Candidatus Brockarchaeota archaeon]
MSETVEGFLFMNGVHYWRHGHTWAKVEDGKARVGLSSLGAEMAGDIILLRFKPVGSFVEQGKAVCTIETAKWVGGVESPVSGEIVEVNEQARRSPRIVRKDPYGQGWLALIKPANMEADAENLVAGAGALDWFREEARKWIERKKG